MVARVTPFISKLLQYSAQKYVVWFTEATKSSVSATKGKTEFSFMEETNTYVGLSQSICLVT